MKGQKLRERCAQPSKRPISKAIDIRKGRLSLISYRNEAEEEGGVVSEGSKRSEIKLRIIRTFQ